MRVPIGLICLLGCAHGSGSASGGPSSSAELATASHQVVDGWLAAHHATAVPVTEIVRWRDRVDDADLPIAVALPHRPGQDALGERLYRVGEEEIAELALVAPGCRPYDAHRFRGRLGASTTCPEPITYELAHGSDGAYTLLRVVTDVEEVVSKTGCADGGGGMAEAVPPRPTGIPGLRLGIPATTQLQIVELHVRGRLVTYTCTEPARP